MARIAGLTRNISCAICLSLLTCKIFKERSNLKRQIPEKISVRGNLAHTTDKLVVPIPPVHDYVVRWIMPGRVETTKEGDCHNKALDTRAGRIAVRSSQGESLKSLVASGMRPFCTKGQKEYDEYAVN
jgi:hypothetical protein